jgi:hypothetical protein
LQVCFERCTDSEENQGTRLCPLFICVAHDGCLQRPVNAFHETIGCWMVGGSPGKLNSSHFGQRVEELQLELTSLVGGDGLWATEAGYPAGKEGTCHGFSCDVWDGVGFWPAREAVDRS